MKLMIIDKKSIICMFYALAVAIIAPLGSKYILPASVTERSIPIYCVETDKKEVAITFDSAWGNEDMSEILKVLGEYDCKATFFAVGDFLDKYPNDVKTIAKLGHEVANHSDSHKHYGKMSYDEIIADMNRCDSKIKQLTGKDNTLFRAPYGEYTNQSVKACNDTGRYCIQWDCDSLDWKGLTADKIDQRIIKNVKNGSIILLHNGAKHTAEALPILLNSLKNEGYTFKTVSELIYKDNFYIDNAGTQKLR